MKLFVRIWIYGLGFMASPLAHAEFARRLDCELRAVVDSEVFSIGVFSADIEDSRGPDGSLPNYVAVPKVYNENDEHFLGSLGMLFLLCTDPTLCVGHNYSVKLTHTLRSSLNGKPKKVAQSLRSGVFEATNNVEAFALDSGYGNLERVEVDCRIH